MKERKWNMTEKQMPEQATITGQADRALNPLVNEILWFHLKKRRRGFLRWIDRYFKMPEICRRTGGNSSD